MQAFSKKMRQLLQNLAKKAGQLLSFFKKVKKLGQGTEEQLKK
jgi:hypothetical protein